MQATPQKKSQSISFSILMQIKCEILLQDKCIETRNFSPERWSREEGRFETVQESPGVLFFCSIHRRGRRLQKRSEPARWKQCSSALSLSWRCWMATLDDGCGGAAAAPVSNSKILIDVRLPTFLPSLSARSHTEYSDGQNVTICDIVRVRSSRFKTHPYGTSCASSRN